jgi:hypothetical protein
MACEGMVLIVYWDRVDGLVALVNSSGRLSDDGNCVALAH